MKLTKALVYAAARDAAERSKRERRITVWDDIAADAFIDEFDRLFEAVGGPEGWMNLPST